MIQVGRKFDDTVEWNIQTNGQPAIYPTREEAIADRVADGMIIPAGETDKVLAFREVMDTKTATDLFEFIQFSAPYVVVKRKSDGQRGTLEFTHLPRWYFNFEPYD